MIISERDPDRGSKGNARAYDGPTMVPDADALRRWVETLSRPRHALAEKEDNRRTRKALCEALEALGYAITVQGAYSNVLALPREGERRPLTLVGAHYDTVPRSPGADDNGSGLAVLLECARLLRTHAPHASVGFVCFNNEEDGLLGSADFVANHLPVMDRRVRAVHVLEMVGYRPHNKKQQRLPFPWIPRSLRTADFIALIGRGNGNAIVEQLLQSDAARDTRLIGARTLGPLERCLVDLQRSDHYPFWREGTPAVLWTDTGDFRNPHYHQRSDTPETLDYPFMQGVGELLATALAHGARNDRR